MATCPAQSCDRKEAGGHNDKGLWFFGSIIDDLHYILAQETTYFMAALIV
jgi:hypothetical protein